MQRTRVSSSNIASIGYDASSQVLEVQFRSGSVYQYSDVPASLHQALMMASSHEPSGANKSAEALSDMGISFHKDMRIAGYRPATFKNGLRGFERTRSPGSTIDLKSVFPHRRDGAIVFEECLDRRLIEAQDGFRLTPGG